MASGSFEKPKDYQKFYHTNKDGDIWLDGRSQPIPLAVPLTTHVSTISPDQLFQSMKTRGKFLPQVIPKSKNNPPHSTPLRSDTSQIPDHTINFEVSEIPQDMAVATVKDLAQDPNISSGLLSSALNTVANFLSPKKNAYPEKSHEPSDTHSESSHSSAHSDSSVPHNKTEIQKDSKNDEYFDKAEFDKQLNAHKNKIYHDMEHFKKES